MPLAVQCPAIVGLCMAVRIATCCILKGGAGQHIRVLENPGELGD